MFHKEILSLFAVLMFSCFALAGGEQEIEQVEDLLTKFKTTLKSDDVDSFSGVFHPDFQIARHIDGRLVIENSTDFLNIESDKINADSEMRIKIMEVYGMVGSAKVVFNGPENKSTFFLNLVKEGERWLIFSATVDKRGVLK